MKQILARSLLLLTLLLILAGCADAQLGKLTLASQIDENGQSLADADTFAPGDTVYLSVELVGAYKGLSSSVTWRCGEDILATEEIAAPRSADKLDPLFITSKLETSNDWAETTYQCEIFVPDQGKTTLEFTLNQGKK